MANDNPKGEQPKKRTADQPTAGDGRPAAPRQGGQPQENSQGARPAQQPSASARALKSGATKSQGASGTRSVFCAGPCSRGRGTKAVRRPSAEAAARSLLCAATIIASPGAMLRQWRVAVIVIAVLAAVITPTVDPVNMALVMGPLLGLYFLGVIMARAVYKPKLQAGVSPQEA